jgi:Flp pilus assembly pilin Flp
MQLPTLRDPRGQTIAEYAIIIAAVAVILVLSLLFVGSRIGGVLGRAGDAPSSAPLKPPVVSCDPNYGGACVPMYPPDVDCSDLRALGIGQVTVLDSDPHKLDPDEDGVGCN